MLNKTGVQRNEKQLESYKQIYYALHTLFFYLTLLNSYTNFKPNVLISFDLKQ